MMKTRWWATMSIFPSLGYWTRTCTRSSIMYPKKSQLARSMRSMVLKSVIVSLT